MQDDGALGMLGGINKGLAEYISAAAFMSPAATAAVSFLLAALI